MDAGAAGRLEDFLGESGPRDGSVTLGAPGSQQSVREVSREEWPRDDWYWSGRDWSWSRPWRSQYWGSSWYGEASEQSRRGTAEDAVREEPEPSTAAGAASADVTAAAASSAISESPAPQEPLDPWAVAQHRPEQDQAGWHEHSWRWSSWDTWSPWTTWHNRQWRDEPRPDQHRPWNESYVKPDLSDPPAWPGWSHRRQWSLAIKRWDKNTDVPLHRRADKVLRSMGWEMQSDFEHLSEARLTASTYLEDILGIIDNKAGVREDDEKRRAFRVVMSENFRRKDETLAQFAVRRQKDFSKAADFGVSIPPELRASMLKEGAQLSDQNLQNLTTLVANNEYDPDLVCRALGRMDVRNDRLVGFVTEEHSENFLEGTAEQETDSEDEEVILAELDGMNLFEDQVHEVYAVLESKRRSWKENKIYKANIRKDRGSFSKSETGSTAPRGPHGGIPGGFERKGRRPKMNKEQLKKITRCRRCLKKGHWAEDCTNPPAQQPAGGSKVQGFVYTGSSAVAPTSAFTYFNQVFLARCVVQQVIREVCEKSVSPPGFESFLSIASGDAILDIGATQDLIGKVAFEAMQHRLAAAGLRAIMVDAPAAVPSGIGGAAQVKGVALIPICPGGVPGVLEFTVLENDVPPLLSVGFLEFLGAEISLVSNTISFTELGVEVPMQRLSTGHRTIPLVQWSPNKGSFPVPDEIKGKFGLADKAFDLDPQIPSGYTKGSECAANNQSTSWLSSNDDDSRDCQVRNMHTSINEPMFVVDGRPSSHVPAPCPSNASFNSDEKFQEQPLEPHLPLSSTSSKLLCHHEPIPSGTFVGSEQDNFSLMGSKTSCEAFQFEPVVSPRRHGAVSPQHRESDLNQMVSIGGQGDLRSGVFTAHVAALDQFRTEEQEGRDYRQTAVCGACEQPFGTMSAPYEEPSQTWQPIRQLDALWSMWKPSHLCAQGLPAQGKAKEEFQPSYSGYGGGGAGDDGTFMHHKGGSVWSANKDLKCSGKHGLGSNGGGDEDSVRVPSGDDDRHDAAEFPDDSNGGSHGVFHAIPGNQSIPDADHVVQSPRRCEIRCQHERGRDPSTSASQLDSKRVSLEHAGEPQSIRGPGRQVRWPLQLVSAAYALSAVVPGRQATPEVKHFVTQHGLRTEFWLLHDEAIPDGSRLAGAAGLSGVPELSKVPLHARASSNHKECHEGQALGFSELPEHSKAPLHARACSNHGECPDGRASSISELPLEDRADIPQGSPGDRAGSSTSNLHRRGDQGDRRALRHGGREVGGERKGELSWKEEPDLVEEVGEGEGKDRKIGGFTLPSASYSVTLTGSRPASYPISTHHQPIWVTVMEVEAGTILMNQPFCQDAPPMKDVEKGTYQTVFQCLTPKAFWVASWADQIDQVVSFDENFQLTSEGPFWAVSSTSLSEALEEREGKEVQAKGHLSELGRCGRSLCLLARSETDKDHRCQLDFAELFSPPRVTPIAQKMGLKVDMSTHFDLSVGWDVRKADHRQQFRDFQQKCCPRFLTLSPECRAYSQLMNVNWDRMDEATKEKIIHEGKLMWNFSLESAETQEEMENYFALEHPAGASSWKGERVQRLLRRPSVCLIEFDMCALGLSVVKSGELSKKSTKVLTNHPWLAYQLCLRQCSGDHQHVRLENGLPRRAQIYPEEFCRLLAQAAQDASLRLPPPSFLTAVFATGLEEEELEEEEGHEPLADAPLEEDTPEKKVTDSQRRMVLKVHVNTGHPPQEQFLRMMKAGGALPHVLKFIKEEFKCDQCSIKNRPDNRRRAHCPRSFAFNRVLSIDVLFVKFQQKSVPILNMVCTGSNYQVAQRLPIPEGSQGGTPTSENVWRHFLHTWVRFFGPPSMLTCDSGNEFKGRFERGCESLGILQHVILPECPWQNAKAERHGGWLKEKLDKEVNSGACTFTSLAELDDFLSFLTATKNRWFSRSGYTPAALVFGETPRIPGELLSDDFPGLCGHQDAHSDPTGVDEAATEFRRRHEIRERARQAAMEQVSKEAISKAVRSSTHQSRHWAAGQWVYVFRRGRPSQELHPRDRWVGPGVVVLSNNRVVYVAMRTRLWRCAPEQLRAAMPSEVLGQELASSPGLAELLRQVNSGTYKGAVDVTRELPPSSADQVAPVERDHHGVDAGIHQLPEREVPTEGPQEVAPVPEGILPTSNAGPGTETVPEPTSRRASRESTRTISEPEPMPHVEAPPGLEVIQEDPEEEAIIDEILNDQPPTKVPRLGGVSEAAASSSSSSRAAQEEVSTRVPGTPILRFAAEPAPGTIGTPAPLTPVEDLSADEGRVARQVEEIEDRERTPRRGSGRDQSLLETPLTYFCSDYQGGWVFLAKRGDEISLKELSREEKELFEQADLAEWQAILNTKAVRVVQGKEAGLIRQRHADRIISSRMVRRKKPQPGLNVWKAKSRWCLHGHADPDTGTLITYAPTPQAEGMAMFLQAALNLEMKVSFGDIKNAFCQSDPIQRARGPLFAEPCEGLNLPPGALIAIDVPVYGLDDAPASWRATVTKFLVEDLKFERNLVEPCWFSKVDSKSGQVVAQIMVEVDDFIVAAISSYFEELKKSLTTRFHFGKWEDNDAEYAGRAVKCLPDRILIDQEKYILEQIFPLNLAKSRKGQPDSILEKEEFEAFRSLIYKLNWVGRETRPEVAGTASIMASRLPQAKIRDAITVNKVVNHLRCTASRPLIIWKFLPDQMVFIVCSDAGGINTKHHDLTDEDGLPTDATQGGWMVLTAERLPEGNRAVKATPITWRSSKLKRKVFSTFGGETQAMLQGVNEVDWLQIMYRDAVFHDVQLKSWRNSLSPHMVIMKGDLGQVNRQPQCSVTDAKSLYDCLLRENPSGKQDRKSALELAIILKDLQDTKSMIRWVPHQKMLVDCMTKESIEKSNGAMSQFLKSGWLSLVDVQEELAHRKNDAAFKNRSHRASTNRLLKEYADQLQSFCISVWSTLSGGYCVKVP